MTSIQTNRGCPADCIFCLVKQVSGRRIASRSPVSIAEEMVFCRERFGIDNFYFRADTFTWDKQWVIEVCRRIIDTKLKFHWVANSRVDTVDEERLHWMKKSGSWMVGFGAESGDQTILEWIKKGITREEIEKAVALCNRAGIKSYLFWVLGFPWDSDATVRNTISFARGLKSDFAEFHLAFPFPGTEFYRIGLENNLFSKSDLAKGNVKQGIARTIFLPREKLRDYHRMAIRKYYLDARRIGRLLRGIGSPKVFLNYCRKAWDVLGGA
jgi:radical SAM superfamily enzyme YgiQ (UPF0313 family)